MIQIPDSKSYIAVEYKNDSHSNTETESLKRSSSLPKFGTHNIEISANDNLNLHLSKSSDNISQTSHESNQQIHNVSTKVDLQTTVYISPLTKAAKKLFLIVKYVVIVLTFLPVALIGAVLGFVRSTTSAVYERTSHYHHKHQRLPYDLYNLVCKSRQQVCKVTKTLEEKLCLKQTNTNYSNENELLMQSVNYVLKDLEKIAGYVGVIDGSAEIQKKGDRNFDVYLSSQPYNLKHAIWKGYNKKSEPILKEVKNTVKELNAGLKSLNKDLSSMALNGLEINNFITMFASIKSLKNKMSGLVKQTKLYCPECCPKSNSKYAHYIPSFIRGLLYTFSPPNTIALSLYGISAGIVRLPMMWT